MNKVRETIINLFTPVKPLPSGIYHYQAPPDDARNYRLHLRIEPDGNGILIVNAATILHLNQTAAEYAYHLIHNTPDDQVVRNFASRYRVSRQTARQDYQQFKDRVDTLVTIPDLDPVTFLDFDLQAPYTGSITAPYRLDCALTYRLLATVDPDSAPQKLVRRELTTAEWETILTKTWQLGIPHVIFTGGEPTLREDLAQLIQTAETLGQVTGLMTDGIRLSEKQYLNTLLQTGLDYVMIIFDPQIDLAWKAIKQVIDEDIFTAVHLTLTPANSESCPELLKQIANIGVKNISLSAVSNELDSSLIYMRELVANLNLALVWDLPVPYSHLNPVALEIEQAESVSGAGHAWLYVEPDGDVLHTQGVGPVIGNIMTDSWERIWSARLS